MVNLLWGILTPWWALAETPVTPVAPEPVARVACVRPVTFTTPHPWSWSAEHTPIHEGSAVLVVADAELLRPRDVGQRVLYVDGWPAEVLWTDGDHALVLAPGPMPPGSFRAWFADETLPERVDAAHRERMTADAARLAGMVPGRVDVPLTLAADALRSEWVPALVAWARGCEGAQPVE